ncbi:MAG: hypothetical protein P9X22_09355 [Candidatus Zapsychrus exili]|nr:hypothetical protein [Candidatus Zapsychrus exili]
MRSKRMIIAVFLCVFAMLMFSSKVFSEETLKDEGAAFLVEVAKSHYQRGQMEQAAHEFSKVLLINSDNEEALEYLKKLGMSRGLYSKQKTRLSKKMDMSKELDSREFGNKVCETPKVAEQETDEDLPVIEQEIVEQIEEGNKGIIYINEAVESKEVVEQKENVEDDDIVEVGAAQVSLATTPQLGGFEDEISTLVQENEIRALEADVLQAKIKDLKEMQYALKIAPKKWEIKEGEISNKELERISKGYAKKTKNLRKQLFKQKQDLDEQMSVLKKKDNELALLKDVSKEASLQSKEIDKIREDYAKRISRISELVLDQEDAKSDGISDISLLKEKSESASKESLGYERKMRILARKYNEAREEAFKQEQYNRRMLAVLEDYLYARKNIIGSLGDKVVYKKMRIANTENKLLDRIEELIDMHDDVDYYLSRIEDRDELVDAKNEDLIYLRSKVGSNGSLGEKNKDLKYLWSRLEAAQEKLFSKKENISLLEKRLKETQFELNKLKRKVSM